MQCLLFWHCVVPIRMHTKSSDISHVMNIFVSKTCLATSSLLIDCFLDLENFNFQVDPLWSEHLQCLFQFRTYIKICIYASINLYYLLEIIWLL